MKGYIHSVRQNAFLRNSIVLFIGTMIVNVLNYVFHLVIGRMVSPSAYGEIESLVSLLTIISVPAGTLTLIATKYAAQMRAKQDRVGTEALSVYFNQKFKKYGIPILFLMFLLTPLVKEFLDIETYLPIFFLWGVMILSFLSAVTIGLLTGWQHFFDVNKISVFSTVLKLFCVGVLVWMGLGVNGVWGGLMLAAIFGYLFSLYFLKQLTKHRSVDEEKKTDTELVKFSSLKGYILPVFYGTLAMAIFGNADMIFAKHHLEAAASGEYGALSVVAKTIFFVTGVLTTVLFAMSAEDSVPSARTVRTFRYAFWLVCLISFGAILFFSLFPQFVLSLLFGEKYLSASPLLGWFALAAGVYSLANLLMQYLLSLHETAVTRFLLALSGLEIGALFFFGENLYAIIGITIGIQVLAVAVGFAFIVKQKKYV